MLSLHSRAFRPLDPPLMHAAYQVFSFFGVDASEDQEVMPGITMSRQVGSAHVGRDAPLAVPLHLHPGASLWRLTLRGESPVSRRRIAASLCRGHGRRGRSEQA